jgi:O-antigen/teichoic acid export membrane protein
VLSALASAGISVLLALRGFGYLSFAWASAGSTAVGMALYLGYWRDRSMFRPLLREWGSVFGFGLYDSASALIAQVADSLPYFIFGRLFDAAAVGLVQRAVMLCMVPERVILAGVSAVALPAFAQSAREGKNLRVDYLNALSLITAAQWPSLVILMLLAQPLVSLLLGAQWLGAIPLMQILAGALLFSFPITLHYAIVVSSGAIRYMPVILLLQSLVSVSVLYVAAHYGLSAAAWSTWLIFPSNCLVALAMARHLTGFRWREVSRALYKSVIVTVLCAAGPAVIVWGCRGAPIGVGFAALALLLAASGWLAGLRVTRHPLLGEMLRVAGAARTSRLGARLFGA